MTGNPPSGKTAIVTGANSGIGFACALGLASKGCQVIVATRNAQKGQEAAKGINEAVNFLDLVEFMELNTADFRSIEKFVEEFKASGRPLHILINNAGTMMPKDQQGEKTNEGFEVTMGTNYFGPMYLTQLLLDNLKQSAPARIVNLGSCSEYGGRVPWDDLKGEQRRESNFDAYGSTKVMLMMAAKALNERLKGTGVEAFSAHPGVTTTPLYEKSDRANKPWAFAVDVAQKLYGQSEERGASPILYAAASPEVTGRGGAFIGGPVGNVAWTGATNLDQFKEREASTTPAVQDPEECRRLYEATLKIIDEAAKQRVRA
ncbi:hypothetical protein WJX72_005314 [[Myrmecia] bisecta]|uniref:Uncharacterized protein n=1 Tax=[Myrmecia] bisecta TaxID=41462 RepID=A0AAW1R5S4_9CHLO